MRRGERLVAVASVVLIIVAAFPLAPVAAVGEEPPAISVSKDGPASAPRGGSFAFSITVAAGDQPLANVVLTDLLPASIVFQSALPPPTTTSPLAWSIGALGPGEQAAITLDVSHDFASGSGSVVNVATAQGELADGSIVLAQDDHAVEIEPIGSLAVIAHIDGGINPYNPVFRDDSPLGKAHPCLYVPGYPCSAPALSLSLNEASFDAAFTKDKPIWDELLRQWNNTTRDPAKANKSERDLLTGKMFWIPGTKIVGALRMTTGGHNCTAYDPPPAVLNRPNINQTDPVRSIVATNNSDSDRVTANVTINKTSPQNSTVGSNQFPITFFKDGFGCPDYPILDDHGHATMTATRMGGNQGSLCPECRIVSIEGLGGSSTKWAADQGWVDVQTNSWLNLVPPPLNQQADTTTAAFKDAQDKMLVFAASGNGAAYINGVAPTPTEILSTAAPGVILVGAHDNGYAALWSGAPAHVVADGYGGLRGENKGLGFGPHPVSCCTSAASPYAAGGGAAIVLAARQILGDIGTGLRPVYDSSGNLVTDKAIANGTAPAGLTGILAKGYLTLDEAKDLVKHTAEARPLEGKDDGLLHWAATGNPTSGNTPQYISTWGPGANPFCQGCTTSPVKWSDVPASVAAYASIGFGAINERSVALAGDVLQGITPVPDRSDVDAFFAAEAQVREHFFKDSVFEEVPPLPDLGGGPILGNETIHGGNPATGFGAGLTESSWVVTGVLSLQGVDGVVLAIPAGSAGKTLSASGISDFDDILLHDLDIYFYGANRIKMVGGSATGDADESAVIPVGAAYVVVDLFLGAEVDVTVTIA